MLPSEIAGDCEFIRGECDDVEADGDVHVDDVVFADGSDGCIGVAVSELSDEREFPFSKATGEGLSFCSLTVSFISATSGSLSLSLLSSSFSLSS